MTSKCYHPLFFCGVRLAQLDITGVPDPGPKNLYVSDQQIELQVTTVVKEGVSLEQTNGCDDICLTYEKPDQLKGLTFTLTMCDADPEFAKLLLGGTLLTAAGTTIGFAAPRVGAPGNPGGVSLEGWAQNITGGDIDDEYPYVRWVFPKTRWAPGDRTLSNALNNTVFTGKGYENDNFYDGPANDWEWPDDAGALYSYAGDISVPAATCGAQALVAS